MADHFRTAHLRLRWRREKRRRSSRLLGCLLGLTMLLVGGCGGEPIPPQPGSSGQGGMSGIAISDGPGDHPAPAPAAWPGPALTAPGTAKGGAAFRETLPPESFQAQDEGATKQLLFDLHECLIAESEPEIQGGKAPAAATASGEAAP